MSFGYTAVRIMGAAGPIGPVLCIYFGGIGKLSVMSIRLAAESDLDAVVRLTTAYRERLAGWAPRWWRKSSSADQAHPGWLAHMLRSEQFTFRVVEVDGVVEGCAVSVPQKAQWFIDDVAVIDDDRWPSGGVEPPWDPWRLHALEGAHATLSATMDENGGVSGKARLTLVRGARLED